VLYCPRGQPRAGGLSRGNHVRSATGVAGEHPDRDRAAFGVGEQPVLDLQLAFLAVAGVAAGGRAGPGP
jgi:hypothetical protein